MYPCFNPGVFLCYVAGVFFLPKGTGFGTAIGLLYYLLRNAYKRFFEKLDASGNKNIGVPSSDSTSDNDERSDFDKESLEPSNESLLEKETRKSPSTNEIIDRTSHENESAGDDDATKSRGSHSQSRAGGVQMVKVDIEKYDTECGC